MLSLSIKMVILWTLTSDLVGVYKIKGYKNFSDVVTHLACDLITIHRLLPIKQKNMTSTLCAVWAKTHYVITMSKFH